MVQKTYNSYTVNKFRILLTSVVSIVRTLFSRSFASKVRISDTEWQSCQVLWKSPVQIARRRNLSFKPGYYASAKTSAEREKDKNLCFFEKCKNPENKEKKYREMSIVWLNVGGEKFCTRKKVRFRRLLLIFVQFWQLIKFLMFFVTNLTEKQFFSVLVTFLSTYLDIFIVLI